jgi:hypothetical protein
MLDEEISRVFIRTVKVAGAFVAPDPGFAIPISRF